MIKKILSLLLVFVLLLSTISCTGLWPYTNNEQEPGTDNEQEPDTDNEEEKIGGDCANAFYTASYEEVKNALDVINEREVNREKKKVFLLDSFENEYEITYYFVRGGSITASAKSLEEFYTAPKNLDGVSWNAVLYFGECSHEGEDIDHRRYGEMLITLNRMEHRAGVVLAKSEYIINEAPNPELWTVEKDSRMEQFDTFTYNFLYDGKVIHYVYSCFELDEEILGKFREDIINAYLPAAE